MTAAANPSVIDPASIAVVTVNWNRWAVTLRCLAALRTSHGAKWHLFVVDNASSDGSLDHLQELGDDVTLIQSSINGGWTGGNNLGVRKALEAGYRQIFILNNDAFVEPETLKVLQETKLSLGENAILGPIHMDEHGAEVDFVGADLDAETGLALYKSPAPADFARLPDLIDTTMIMGAGIFADAAQFERLGLFDDRFYLNFDELDWCFRAREAGYRLVMVKQARILHMGSASIGGAQSPLNIYFMTRNAMLFAERHCTAKQRWRLFRVRLWEARDRWMARNTASASGGRIANWWRFLLSSADPDAAFKRGVLDYIARRFGDCPAIVRSWGQPRPQHP